MAQPLKDMVDRGVVDDIANRVAGRYPSFNIASFTTDLMEELPALELKPRIAAIAGGLHRELPIDFPAALEILVEVARAEPPIEGFAAWPLCTFVELYGVDHPAESLRAMEHLTKRASCEFAIRPFLRQHWAMAYATLERFTANEDESVRRLASEGTRPRLPWGANVEQLTDDPQQGLALLELLRHDPSAVVRRSVANHLNDVAKTHPALVVELTRRWSSEPETDAQMISHALRTLVKVGDPAAFAVLGFTTDPDVEVVEFSVTPDRVEMGDRIELHATLRSTANSPQRLVVDFVIHHVNASSKTSPKVFKWSTLELEPGETTELTKRRLIQMASTRTYHPGRHLVELQVAGGIVATDSFDVVVLT